MSWNNVLPGWMYFHIAWENHSLMMGAMPGEFHASEFHDHFWP